MDKLILKMAISAPRERVWEVLLNDESYREWTSVFTQGSYFEGDWSEGSEIRFLTPDNNGLLSRIQKHLPNQEVVIEHLAEVKAGVTDENAEASDWQGALEIYRVSEENGHTTLEIEQDLDEKYHADFKKIWDQALEKVKMLAEVGN